MLSFFGGVGLWFVLCHPHWFLIHCNLKITSFSELAVDLHLPGSSSWLFHLHSSSSLLSFFPAKGFAHLGYLLCSGTLLTIFFCPMTYLDFLFSFFLLDFEWRRLSKTEYSELLQRGLTLWRGWYQMSAPFLLHFLDINVLLSCYRVSIACHVLFTCWKFYYNLQADLLFGG